MYFLQAARVVVRGVKRGGFAFFQCVPSSQLQRRQGTYVLAALKHIANGIHRHCANEDRGDECLAVAHTKQFGDLPT
ncbi:hypothetical protein [Stenotrophomonas maltophilia]|uniref:hypothetical protein n=1 Tax=Stenotrophomonas maltophilia TaxID=40324 RepID=UPI003D76026A